MSTFAEELAKWGDETEISLKDAFTIACEEVKRSILDGSELTGAPGQPVIFGNLYNSWIDERPTDTEYEISTNVDYAPSIEDGANDHAFFDPSREQGSPTNPDERSPVGGYHSVRLTEASWDRIAEFAAQKAFGHVVEL